ncbi:MAG: type II secretion system F family protein, partial [Eubacteriales bacterium]|nr:type II secretion system F family protein [Eubacteriales bacterium]
MIQALLYINSALILLLNVIIANHMITVLNIGSMAKRALDQAMSGVKSKRTGTDLKRYASAVSVKATVPERISIVFIERSNIRRYIPLFNLQSLAAIIIASFILIIIPIYRSIGFLPSAIIISIMFSLWPFTILDVMGRYNSTRIRRKLSDFISILNRWCAVKEDIFFAFEKSLDSGIDEPLRSFISDLVIQVQRGVEPEAALELLRMKVGNPQFADFIINIKQCIRSRGEIRKLMTNLEDQFYKIEEEYNRRKISTHRDRIIIYAVMVAVLAISWFLLSFN